MLGFYQSERRESCAVTRKSLMTETQNGGPQLLHQTSKFPSPPFSTQTSVKPTLLLLKTVQKNFQSSFLPQLCFLSLVVLVGKHHSHLYSANVCKCILEFQNPKRRAAPIDLGDNTITVGSKHPF